MGGHKLTVRTLSQGSILSDRLMRYEAVRMVQPIGDSGRNVLGTRPAYLAGLAG